MPWLTWQCSIYEVGLEGQLSGVAVVRIVVSAQYWQLGDAQKAFALVGATGIGPRSAADRLVGSITLCMTSLVNM